MEINRYLNTALQDQYTSFQANSCTKTEQKKYIPNPCLFIFLK